MSVVLSNSTVPYVLMQVVDDAMRNDVHNSMILISTTLGVVLAGFTGVFVAWRRTFRNQVPKSGLDGLTGVSVVSTSA